MYKKKVDRGLVIWDYDDIALDYSIRRIAPNDEL